MVEVLVEVVVIAEVVEVTLGKKTRGGGEKPSGITFAYPDSSASTMRGTLLKALGPGLAAAVRDSAYLGTV